MMREEIAEIEEGNFMTVPDDVLIYLGVEPGKEVKIAFEIEDGRCFMRKA